MPKYKTQAPLPNKQKGQRSVDVADLPLYINRIIPVFGNPIWWTAELWRNVVRRQPIAMICREFLIEILTYLDWKIEPRDSTNRDELKEDMKYYTTFFNYTGDFDWVDLLELLGQDLLDTPFGGCWEIGREGDSPEGKLVWIEPLDSANLFPTYNSNWPVGQQVRDYAMETRYFPKHAINRVLMSPRPELRRKGWGMPPPEKIYLAVELLSRGDSYYANLLLDTPQVGILDLGDMAKDSAEEWVKSWRVLLGGIDPFKIPVLYEHNTKTEYIAFQRSPTELMFDKAISKYDSITTAGYGLTLADLGLSQSDTGGSTLAGAIRSERRTRKTGLSRLKKKVKLFIDRMLPKELEFKWIDLDEETSVAIGRARLANSTAISQLIDKLVLTPEEARLQTIADGLVTISIPEKIPKSDLQLPQPDHIRCQTTETVLYPAIHLS